MLERVEWGRKALTDKVLFKQRPERVKSEERIF